MRVALLTVLFLLLSAAGTIDALSYDYSATTECLAEPLKPQYDGGIILNPEFHEGLKGWTSHRNAKIEEKVSRQGNSFVVAHARSKPEDSFSQKFYMQEGTLYTFSAWIQVSEGKELVNAAVQIGTDYKFLGTVIAESGCWSMLKGGFTADSSGPAELYFESKNTSVEIWADSVSLQPFSQEQWRFHQDQSVQNTRKRKLKIQAIDAQGKSLAGAAISIKLKKPSFPFGAAINKAILSNTAYQKWFTSRFTVTAFTNEMKWYSTELIRGKEDYRVPDAMLKFAQKHGISVRGHNVFWENETMQPDWVRQLQTARELKKATRRRINSVVSRYAGKLIAWDVVNENMHWSFFADRLEPDFSAFMYYKTHQLDPRATLFLNEYNTIEYQKDTKSTPAAYIQKLKETRSYLAKYVQIGIGLQGHFVKPDIAYMRSALDTLAATKMPIWLTEVDTMNCSNPAQSLEAVLREGHSHPGVEGIVMWMQLTDPSFHKILPEGDVVDKLIHKWTKKILEAVTDDNGYFETLLFHGDYEVRINHPTTNSSMSQRIELAPTDKASNGTTLHFQI